MSKFKRTVISDTAMRCEAKPLGHSRNHCKYQKKPNDIMSSIGNYKVLRLIGEGNFAKVVLAKHIVTGVHTAIKIINKNQFNPTKLMKLYREVSVMKLLSHPNIVRLYEVIESSSKIFLVMEYVQGGELYDYIVSKGRLNEEIARRLFRQLISAVGYCHRLRVIHRDLKVSKGKSALYREKKRKAPLQ